MSYFIVYKTTNIINGKIYIGIHKQKSEEFDGYLGSGMLLNNAIDKYGAENFHRETLFTFSDLQSARQKEREIVDMEFCKRTDTYNISIGGTGGNTIAGYTEEMLSIYRKNAKLRGKKISETLAKRIQDMPPEDAKVYKEEKKRRFLEIRIQPDNKGRVHTGQALQNIIDANHMIGKMHFTNGEENILLYPEDEVPIGFYRGRVLSEDKRFKGHSKEILANMSELRKGKIYATDGVTTKLFDRVEDIPDGWRRGLNVKKDSRHKGKWITNGKTSKKLMPGEPMPDGWEYGRRFEKDSNDK